MTATPAETPLHPRPALWIPLLSHYRADNRASIDEQRATAQLAFLRPYVSRFLVAGSTGDGWDMHDATFTQLVSFALTSGAFSPDDRIIFGALQPTTEGVVRRVRIVQDLVSRAGSSAPVSLGVAVCPPVDVEASQSDILAHYRRVLDATSLDLAVYQLPQVTRCRIEPDTMRAIADHPCVTMFKDSSGDDTIARQEHRGPSWR